MVQYQQGRLDASFAALADGTRRGVLEQLGRAECSVTDLAEEFDMTLTGMKKHTCVLEEAGLVVTEKRGRVRYCRVGTRRLDEVAARINAYQQVWDSRFSALDEVLERLETKGNVMDGSNGNEVADAKLVTIERTSDREVVVTRAFDAPVHLVSEAWSNPELFQKWWIPKSMGMTLHACEMDVRTGGMYRLSFGEGMDFFGRYIDVTPPSRIVWTNEEGGEDASSVTMVTLTEREVGTLLVMSEVYPSKEALDEAGTGVAEATRETFVQLDELLVTMG